MQSLRSAVERAQERQGLGLKKGKGAVIVSHSFLRLHSEGNGERNLGASAGKQHLQLFPNFPFERQLWGKGGGNSGSRAGRTSPGPVPAAHSETGEVTRL